MNALLTRLAAAAGLALAAPFASATVLDFDDLSPAAEPVPAHYGGLDWSAAGWLAFDGSDTSLPYTPHSGTQLATLGWDGSDATSLIRFGQAATFEGAWFSGYAEGELSFQLWYQGKQVAASATLTPGATPSFLASGYAGLVDAVSITSSGHAFYAMDDFTFNTTAVPEPSALLLMLGGLGLVAAARRRRERAQGEQA